MGCDRAPLEEDGPVEAGLKPEGEEPAEPVCGRDERGGDGEDDREHQRVESLADECACKLAEPGSEELMPPSRKDACDESERREGEEEQDKNLGQDDGERERAEQGHGPEVGGEDEGRHREPLEAARLLLDVDSGAIVLVHPVAVELPRLRVRVVPGAQEGVARKWERKARDSGQAGDAG